VHNELDDLIVPLVLINVGYSPMDEALWAAKEEAIFAVFTQIEQWLVIRSFLVAERFSIADIALAVTVHAAYTLVKGRRFFEQLLNLRRHRDTCMAQPTVVGVFERIPESEAKEKAAARQ
jgi:glutathione S-transferase